MFAMLVDNDDGSDCEDFYSRKLTKAANNAFV